MLNMGIHHIDTFRYLFGDPEKVTAITRSDPRTKFPHIDGITQYTFQYADEMIATSLDDVWAWQGEGTQKDMYIRWRVEGLDGMAQGEIGWPKFPQFLRDIVSSSSMQLQRDESVKFDLRPVIQGNRAQLDLSIFNQLPSGPISATITRPSREKIQTVFQERTKGSYIAWKWTASRPAISCTRLKARPC